MIVRRNDLKPPPAMLGLIQNGDSQPRKPAIKNNEKCVAFQKEEEKQKVGNEKALMISYEKVKRHKQRWATSASLSI